MTILPIAVSSRLPWRRRMDAARNALESSQRERAQVFELSEDVRERLRVILKATS